MNLVKKLICGATLAVTMMASASASVVINNWKFNPLGTGAGTAQTVNEYLDVNGNAFIQLAVTGPGTFNFTEHAVFNISQADSNGQLFPVNYAGGYITATFEATGTGTFGGGFTFNGGSIKMYHNMTNQYGSTTGFYGANLGTLIADFDVLVGGGGVVNPDGSPINNGNVSVFAKATTPGGMTPGYFFRGNGNDMSNEDILSFAFVNANTLGKPTTTQVKEIACEMSGFAGAGCPTGVGYNNTPFSNFFVGNNGQFKLASEVPEPDSLALLGIALLGAGVISRKRAAKKA